LAIRGAAKKLRIKRILKIFLLITLPQIINRDNFTMTFCKHKRSYGRGGLIFLLFIISIIK